MAKKKLKPRGRPANIILAKKLGITEEEVGKRRGPNRRLAYFRLRNAERGGSEDGDDRNLNQRKRDLRQEIMETIVELEEARQRIEYMKQQYFEEFGVRFRNSFRYRSKKR